MFLSKPRTSRLSIVLLAVPTSPATCHCHRHGRCPFLSLPLPIARLPEPLSAIACDGAGTSTGRLHWKRNNLRRSAPAPPPSHPSPRAAHHHFPRPPSSLFQPQPNPSRTSPAQPSPTILFPLPHPHARPHHHSLAHAHARPATILAGTSSPMRHRGHPLPCPPLPTGH